jgi:hypothetical protein
MTRDTGDAMAEIQWQPSTPVWDWRAEAARTQMEEGGPSETGGGAGRPLDGGAGSPRHGRAAAAAAARREGAIGGTCGLAAAAALAWLLHRTGLAVVVATASLAAALLAQAAPLTLYRRLRGALDRFGRWMGTGVTWVLMTLLFYLLFLPAGLVMRAAGKLSFTRFAEPRLDSYWTSTAGRTPAPESYRKQF